jgi:amino acid transporter
VLRLLQPADRKLRETGAKAASCANVSTRTKGNGMEESMRATARQFQTGKRRDVLSSQRIVFMVISAAAPLTAMIGNLPIAIGQGNGASLPAAFLFAAVTLLCFSVGYAAMSRRVVNTGAFYTYVARGLGKPAGVGAAFTAMIAYVALTIGLAGFFGYSMNIVLDALGLKMSWYPLAMGGMVAVAVLGYRSIDMSSKILGVLMAAEVIVIVIFDICVLATTGPVALPLSSFTPSVAIAPGLGVAMIVAFISFTGFESAALYGEEAKDPKRSIPRATYASVLLVGILYLITAWLTVGALQQASVAANVNNEGSGLMLNMFGYYSGQIVQDVTGVLLCTSMLASYLALHNAATRYIFALSREKLLPPVLGHFHPARYAPSNASFTVSIITIVSISVFASTGLHPYRQGLPVIVGVGTLGIIVLQFMAAIAVLAYLGKRRSETTLGVLVASAVGAVGLLIATILVATNIQLLATGDLSGIAYLPIIYPVAVIAGLTYAYWLRRFRPKTFGALAEVTLRSDSSRQIAPIGPKPGRYCIVGAGPCGLVAARSFKLAGIPYDHFERHSDVGGIWAIDNPGSSMYESAHFISSKYTSGFFGYPMPDHYPDYPDYRQIHDYIRGFADAFGLRDAIQFGTEIKSADPIGENAEGGWKVVLANGETRTYAGIVCANGVTWHPNKPQYEGLETFKGVVQHSVEYRSPSSFAGKNVLVIGAGNSGVDIACDAARSAKSAMISLRRGYHFVPKHIFGIPTDVFISGQIIPPKGVVIPDDPTKMLEAVVGDLTRYGLPKPDHKAMESHPIMNSQILHYLAHGDLKAKGEVKRFTETGVEFVDGSSAAIDLVLFATGYEYRIPYLNENLFTWNHGHPELYLNIFHRTLKGLSVVGFIEFASAGYQRFDEIAQMAAMDAHIEQSVRDQSEWQRMKAEDAPNLRGTNSYIDSPRHANYVDVTVYRRTLSEIREKFGWPDPDDKLYVSLTNEQSMQIAAE